MIFTNCAIVALILLGWFRTDAWLEYTRMLKLPRLSHYKDFDIKHREDASLTYLLYLRLYHNCFFVRLITCPICLSVWLGIIISIFTSISLIPLSIVGGLLLFTIIDKLLG
jgi:hypothetical protein